MAQPKFYLRTRGENCSIYVLFQLSRKKRLKTSIGVSINSKDWSFTKKDGKEIDNGKPRQNSPENKKLATNLQELSTYLQKQYLKDCQIGIDFSNDWLRNQINDFFKRPAESNALNTNLFSVYLDNYIDYRKLIGNTAVTTERKFHQLKSKFDAYEKKKKKKFLISEIDSRFILTFKQFMMSDLKNMESTANEIIRKLKTVLLNARDEDDKETHKSINKLKLKTIPATKVFLSLAELEKIKESKIVGKDLQHAKDWLIIGCNLGQRVGDLLQMKKEMIYTKTEYSQSDSVGENFNLIEITQEKTNKKVVIPINDEVQTILDKYDGNFPPTFGHKGDSIFVLFNRYIKKVCELSGITNVVKGRVFNEVTKRNEITETEKYKLVSSHICRRSFATNYYGDNRFTTAELMSITGHKTESVFLTYIGKTPEEHALKSAKTFKKIAQEKKAKKQISI